MVTSAFFCIVATTPARRIPVDALDRSLSNSSVPRPSRCPLVSMTNRVSSHQYYGEYHGHLVAHLAAVHAALGSRPRVWLAGDSSLDSKYYQPHLCSHQAINGYELVLEPPLCRRDVCYWLNKELGPTHAVINCAVEESTLGQRQSGLLSQDVFIRDNLREEDVLVVSVGGNDVALKPTLATVFNMLKGVFLNSLASVSSDPSRAWGMNHFVKLLRDDTARYVEQLLSKCKPAAVIICMIYFPDENDSVPSWASGTLRFLAYNQEPAKLQAFIRGVFECATQQIEIGGTETIPCPLYSALDGKDTSLYVARVEPSEAGGEAMAKLISGCVPK